MSKMSMPPRSKFIMRHSSLTKENAWHNDYDVNSNTIGLNSKIVDLNKMSPRKPLFTDSARTTTINLDNLVAGQDLLMPDKANLPSLETMTGRTSGNYHTNAGFPKHTIEELRKLENKYKDKVSFREFLPNSVTRSPLSKQHS